ncbi:reverse transcriptase domain-containing protein [Tanacetum coccineum]|uniref:Reverse transcriptase domain-containing protein n=1 Tax=Tanacetum coccineum TaxID=301880 RepID=A0ABQ5CT10_9ASTR
MQTRSLSKFVGEPSTNPTSTILKRRNRRRSIQRVKPFYLVETPVVTMADQSTMAELLRAPTEGYAEAIVVPPITVEHFELKHSLINLVTSKQFFGFEKEDPHAHIRYFNKITSTLKYKDFEETFSEAWDHFKDLLRACPHHGFTQFHQLDTFYNGLNPSDQDSLNFVVGGNLLERSAQDVLKIIENKSKVHNSRNKPIVSQVKASNVDSSEIASAVASVVTSVMTTMFKQHQVTPSPASVKAVEESCVTCGCAHSYRRCLATDGNTFSGYQDNIQGYVSTATVVERKPEVTKDTVLPSTENIQPPVVQIQAPIDEPVVAPKPKPSIPYPSRANKQKLREKDDLLASKFVEVFRELHFELSFADAILHMPKFATMFKSLLNNKEKLFELASTTSVNENCLAVILKKLPEKLGDPDKFLIPCDFPELDECLALADLCASINLMPLSIWKKLSLPELTLTQMILELADRSTTRPAGIAKDVFMKVGKFHFSADFVVVDYVVDPRVPLILGRPFLRTGRALIDVYGEELTLRHDDEAVTFKVGQTSRYFYNDAESLIESIETDAFLAIEDDSILPKINDSYYHSEGDIRLLEEFLNNDPSSSLPPQELRFIEPKTEKTSIDDPPELELKDLPSHLEYRCDDDDDGGGDDNDGSNCGGDGGDYNDGNDDEWGD